MPHAPFTRLLPLILAALFLAGFLAILGILAAWVRADEPKQRAVVVFDYVSKWDEGRTGQHAAEMAYAKIRREGGFAITEMAERPRHLLDQRHHDHARYAAGQSEGSGPRNLRRRHRHLGQRRARGWDGGRDLRYQDEVRRLHRLQRAQGALRQVGPHQRRRRDPAPLHQGHVEQALWPRAGRAAAAGRDGRAGLEGESQPDRRRRLRVRQPRRAPRLGAPRRPAARAPGQPGQVGPRERQPQEPRDPLRHPQGRRRERRRDVLQRLLPRPGRRQVPFPGPLSYHGPFAQGLHQVL